MSRRAFASWPDTVLYIMVHAGALIVFIEMSYSAKTSHLIRVDVCLHTYVPNDGGWEEQRLRYRFENIIGCAGVLL